MASFSQRFVGALLEDGKHEGKQLSVLLPSVYGGRVEATVDDRDERCDFSLMLGDGSTRFENYPPGSVSVK